LFPDDADAYDELMRGADAAMYEAKRDTKKFGGGSRRVQREAASE
jgi:GGDEF domain-containing protein